MSNREKLRKLLLAEGPGRPMTYDKMGVKLGLTRQRIFQLLKLPEFSTLVAKRAKRAKDYEDLKAGMKRHRHFLRHGFYPGASKEERLMGKKMRYSLTILRQNNEKHNNREFNITLDDIEFPKACPVLGIKLNYFSPKLCDASPSFDRLNCKKGYVKGNVRVISFRANKIKSNASSTEVLKVYKWMKSLNL